MMRSEPFAERPVMLRWWFKANSPWDAQQIADSFRLLRVVVKARAEDLQCDWGA